MSWLYKGEVFNDSKIPEGAVGFIYEMEALPYFHMHLDYLLQHNIHH